MPFDEEWATARADASATVSMRLNQLPPESGGGSPKETLKVSSSVLLGRANKAETVRKNFADADDNVMKETGDVKSGLKGFQSAEAFTTFQTRWRSQMTYLDGLLSVGVAGNLRSAGNDFAAREREEKERHKKSAAKKGGDS